MLQAVIIPSPFTPFFHSIKNGFVSISSKTEFSRRFYIRNDGTLVNKSEIELHDVMTDKQLDVPCHLPKISQYFFLSTNQCLRWIVVYSIANTKNSAECPIEGRIEQELFKIFLGCF